MQKLLNGVITGGLLLGCGHSSVGQGSVEVRSRLPCLAPLIWRWESGEFPLSMGEAFFRGPYRFRDFSEVPDEVAVPFLVEDLKEKPEVQRLFDKGVALVHEFRDQEAERAFRQVVVQAPDCAMAYWGLALANGTAPGRARLFASEAKLRLEANSNEKERMWIEWTARFFDDKTEPDEQERRRQAVRHLEGIVQEFPDDLNARAFLVRQVVLNENRAGMEIGSRLAIDRMIGEILDGTPSFPVRTYRMFLWLNDRPELAEVMIDPFADRREVTMFTAEAMRFHAELCQARGEAEHALSLFEWAVVIEKLRLSEAGQMPEGSTLLPELVGRWTENLGSMGRVKDVESAAAGAAALRRNPYARRNLGMNEAIADARAEAQRSLLRTWIDWGLWERVVEYGMPHVMVTNAYANTVWNFDRMAAVAVAEYFLGMEAIFPRRIAQLERMRESLSVDMRGREEADRFARGVIDELKRFQAFCEDGEIPAKAFRFAGKGRLAWICVEKGLMKEALELAEGDLEERPGHFESRANASAIRFRAGKTKEAVFLLDREFRRQAGRADPDLPVLKELDRVAAALNLPDDWTLPTETQIARSLPEAEMLESELPEASPWTLPNWKGEEVSLADFSGKPVLLVFFLGGGCLHCVQQLTALVPRVPEYREAGIPIVAISSDGVEILSRTLGKEVDPEKAFPFEIVSDRDLKVFKSYGVFDEFEKRALHGTFLVDGDGQIIWRELSHEPFLKPDFLLEEARRLLKP